MTRTEANTLGRQARAAGYNVLPALATRTSNGKVEYGASMFDGKSGIHGTIWSAADWQQFQTRVKGKRQGMGIRRPKSS
jgi:hypothetical protein